MTDGEAKPISVGDLVRVIQNCPCNPTKGIGYIFSVERIEAAYYFYFPGCPHTMKNGEQLAYGRISAGDGYYPLAWLKRIPPLGELETTNTEETICA